MCTCLKSLQRRMAFEKLSMSVPLENCTFESFSLDYYKDDEDFGYDKNSDFASAGGFTFKGDSDDDDLTLELEDSSEEGQLSDEDYE